MACRGERTKTENQNERNKKDARSRKAQKVPFGTAFRILPLNTPSRGLQWVTNPLVNITNVQKKPKEDLW